MKKMIVFEMNEKETAGLEYLAGVPASEKRLYWSDSPWAAFRRLTGERQG